MSLLFRFGVDLHCKVQSNFFYARRYKEKQFLNFLKLVDVLPPSVDPVMMFSGTEISRNELKRVTYKTKIRLVRKPDEKIVKLYDSYRSGQWMSREKCIEYGISMENSGILHNHLKSVQWIHKLNDKNGNDTESIGESIDLRLDLKQHIQEDDSDSSGDDAVDDNLWNYMPISGFEIYPNTVVSDDSLMLSNG